MDWSEIKAWRKSTRAALIASRLAVPQATREQWTAALAAQLEPLIRDLTEPIAGYWPLRGEPDLRGLLGRLAQDGFRIALPVAERLGEAMSFRPWQPGAALDRGLWDIPVPATAETVQPRLVLAPVVGFDDAGYRLGYGGGFFDRTLAVLHPRPLAIGIGYASARLETVYPQAHDVALDFIVTERGILAARDGRLVALAVAAARTAAVALAGALGALDAPASLPAYASPACAAATLVEPDLPTGPLPPAELAALLNVLLEAERAGAQAIAAMLPGFADAPAAHALLDDVRRDEAHNCALLLAALRDLATPASAATGDFVGKVLALSDRDDRLRLLNRGQAWVARRIEAALPRLAPGPTRDMLDAMGESHRANIARCDALLDRGDESR